MLRDMCCCPSKHISRLAHFLTPNASDVVHKRPQILLDPSDHHSGVPVEQRQLLKGRGDLHLCVQRVLYKAMGTDCPISDRLSNHEVEADGSVTDCLEDRPITWNYARWRVGWLGD